MPVDAIVIGENAFPFHRFADVRDHIRSALSAPGLTVETTTDRDAFLDLDTFDVLVDYTTDSALSQAHIDAIVGFVAEGGGYVGVHCAADLTTTTDGSREDPVPELRSLIGGHFVTHPEEATLRVKMVNSHHPISAGLEDFEVWDEPYRVAYDEDLTVLARMDHPDLADMPVLWTRTHAEGAVVYCSLGHGPPAFAHPTVAEILRRSVRWAGSR